MSGIFLPFLCECLIESVGGKCTSYSEQQMQEQKQTKNALSRTCFNFDLPYKSSSETRTTVVVVAVFSSSFARLRFLAGERLLPFSNIGSHTIITNQHATPPPAKAGPRPPRQTTTMPTITSPGGTAVGSPTRPKAFHRTSSRSNRREAMVEDFCLV